MGSVFTRLGHMDSVFTRLGHMGSGFGADCKRHKIRRFNLIVYLFHEDYVQPEVT